MTTALRLIDVPNDYFAGGATPLEEIAGADACVAALGGA
jgi:hypothetical protein